MSRGAALPPSLEESPSVGEPFGFMRGAHWARRGDPRPRLRRFDPRGNAGTVRIHAWCALRAGPARQRAGDMNADASPPGIALNAQVA
jgi:hypothetical protein